MTSQIDPTQPPQGNPTTAAQRANWAAAKAEIEALQAGLAQGSPQFTLNNWLSASQITDVKAGNLTFDAAVPIQAAIDYLTALAPYVSGQTWFDLVIPRGKYNIQSQVVVKANIRLVCNGTIINGIAVANTPMLQFKAGSHCARLVADANSKQGVLFGDAGVTNDMLLGDILVLNGGATQYCARFQGDGFVFHSLKTTLGLIGVDFGDGGTNTCTNVSGSHIRTFNAATGVRFNKVTHAAISRIYADSCSADGLEVDQSQQIFLSKVEAVFNDTVGGAVFANGYAIQIGLNSIASPVTALHMNCEVDNTNGIGVVISYVKNSQIYANVNRAPLSTGNGHNCTTGIQYRTQADSSISIELLAGSVTPYAVLTGTQAGALKFWDGTYWQSLPSPNLIVKRKSADQNIATNTVLQNDADLSFPIAANEEWVVDMELDAGAAMSTTGIKLAATIPAGCTMDFRTSCRPTTFVAANVCAKRTTASATALDYTIATMASQTDVTFKVSVWVKNGGTPGTVQLQWCQSTSSATNTTLRAGSYMMAQRVQ